MRRRFFALLFCVLLIAAPVLAQLPTAGGQDPEPLPTYSVAAIHPDNSDSGNMSWRFEGNGFTAININPEMLLEWAFDIRHNQVFGLPPWAQKAHYDLNAKAVDATPEQLKKLTEQQRRDMAKALLAERFQMRAHYETRDLPTYDLVQAKGGAKLVATGVDDAHRGDMRMSNTELQATGAPLANIAESITGIVGRPVVDKTGLTGIYNIELHWQPDASAGADNGSKEAGDANATIFTALQEQLGLKLQSAHDPIRVLVVDRFEPPSEN